MIASFTLFRVQVVAEISALRARMEEKAKQIAVWTQGGRPKQTDSSHHPKLGGAPREDSAQRNERETAIIQGDYAALCISNNIISPRKGHQRNAAEESENMSRRTVSSKDGIGDESGCVRDDSCAGYNDDVIMERVQFCREVIVCVCVCVCVVHMRNCGYGDCMCLCDVHVHLCLDVYVHVYVCVCGFVVFVYVDVHMCMRMRMCMNMSLCMWMCMCIFMCVYMCGCVCKHVCTCVCVCVCVREGGQNHVHEHRD
jgi:hypothetical protein